MSLLRCSFVTSPCLDVDLARALVARREREADLELDVAGTLIKLNAGTDALVKGTTYRSSEDVMLAALSAALTAIAAAVPSIENITANGPAAATACGTAVTAIESFQAAAASYLSTSVKTG